MTYSICFSITCHECAKCLGDIFERINYYAPNSCAVVCCGETSGEHYYQEVVSVASEYKNIFVNPSKLPAAWGDGRLVNLIMSNFDWAYKNLDFKYFWLEASNAVLINPEIENYVSQYEAGFRLSKISPEFTEWMWTKHVLDDPAVKGLINKLNLSNPYGGQHEGLFAKKEIFKYLYDSIEEYLPLDPTSYPREESLMQTCLAKYQLDNPDLKFTTPGCQMWCNIDIFKKVLSNDTFWMKENKVFSVKPVDRDFNSELRNCLRQTLSWIKQNNIL